MAQVKSNKPTVAIIGLGNIGSVIATNLVKANRNVIVADRNAGKANELSKKLGRLAEPKDIGAAIREADIVVFAVWFEAIKELLNKHAEELKNKVIVDPSNPIAPDGKGGFKKIVDEMQSAGQILSSLIPKTAKFAKALGTLGSASLAGAAYQKPEQAVLFFATDDRNIDGDIEQLIRDNGFEPLRVGRVDQSIRIEVFGDLHEFGALGRTVSRKEAIEKLTSANIAG